MTNLILAIAKVVGVPGSLLLAICTVETKLTNVVRVNDGPSSTYGVCQIKATTANLVGFKGNEQDLMDPKINVKYAARYLKYQLKRYDYNWCKATAGYNHGSYSPSKIRTGRPKNSGYVDRVTTFLDGDDKEQMNCQERVVLR